MIYPGCVGFSSYKTDIAKSKQLMQEAGVGAGFPITLTYSAGDPVQKNIGILLKSTLARLNMRARPDGSSRRSLRSGAIRFR